MKRILFIIVLFFTLSPLSAQLFDHDAMFRSYLNADVMDWGVSLRKVVKRNDLTLSEKLESVHYMYGYVAACLDKKKMVEARFFMTEMTNYLNELEKHRYHLALVNTYRSALSVYEISFSKLKAMYYGKRAMNYLERALALDPNNAFVQSYRGNVYFFMPSFAGGDKKEALKSYSNSVNTFSKHLDKCYQWNYIDAKVSIAKCYEKRGDVDRAIAACRMLLKEQPNCKYVRDVYLPELLRKKQ